MICINIPMPKKCIDCPFSYWVQGGCFEGMLMCNAKEANLSKKEFKSNDEITGECIVDEYRNKRPADCPITGTDIPMFCRYCGKKII